MSMRNPLAVLILAAPLGLLACGGPKQEEAPPAGPAATQAAAPVGGAAATKGSASISGKVTYEGAVPAPEQIKVSADPYCKEQHKEGLQRQTVEVKDGGLANAFVYVKSGVSGSYPPPSGSVTLDQKGCMYSPHIVALQIGQTLKITNSDETLHNIHPRPLVNKEFNTGQPRKGMEAAACPTCSIQTFDKKEVMIPVGCDVHPWMRAYINVLDHPFFAVTDDSGKFEIKGLPAGEYEVEAVHEKLKTATGKITVKDGESAKLDLAYKG